MGVHRTQDLFPVRTTTSSTGYSQLQHSLYCPPLVTLSYFIKCTSCLRIVTFCYLLLFFTRFQFDNDFNRVFSNLLVSPLLRSLTEQPQQHGSDFTVTERRGFIFLVQKHEGGPERVPLKTA